MVGEIRDFETAQIAVQASLTGHLVLSTLHTNTAIGAITRLRDMGIEEFLLSSSLIGIMSQRLLRVLCSKCKILVEKNLYKANGCEYCNNIGYRGRVGVYEIIEIDDKLREMIHDKVSSNELTEYAHRYTQTIYQDGLRLANKSITSMEELQRVLLTDIAKI
jgi:general secretion pathway protein E